MELALNPLQGFNRPSSTIASHICVDTKQADSGGPI